MPRLCQKISRQNRTKDSAILDGDSRINQLEGSVRDKEASIRDLEASLREKDALEGSHASKG
jgi:hypothetical protein